MTEQAPAGSGSENRIASDWLARAARRQAVAVPSFARAKSSGRFVSCKGNVYRPKCKIDDQRDLPTMLDRNHQ
ncbi:MAG: hypothetical protein K0R85_122 [Devosia sp.]|jgi:hypothetical protein|nr:hypothetical protein [Devosia sp.]